MYTLSESEVRRNAELMLEIQLRLLVNINVSMSHTILNKKFSEECVGLCEEVGLQPISELFTSEQRLSAGV